MLDGYSRYARITPVLVACLPLVLLACVAVPLLEFAQRMIALGLLAALAPLFDQLGRSRGRRLELELFQAWGGAPTTQLLRWRGSVPGPVQKRRHRAVGQLAGVRLPTAATERADPAAADAAYVDAVRILRARLADCEPVAVENRSYGLRRNLLGVRRWGLVISVTSAAGVIAWVARSRPPVTSMTVPALLLVTDVALVVLWCAVVRARWVAEAAWGYAERLLDQAEHLAASLDS